MSKKYSIVNMNGDTNNDDKKCSITDMNCLGRDDKDTQSGANSAYSKKNDKTSSASWSSSGSSTREGKDSIETAPDDEIPDNNR